MYDLLTQLTLISPRLNLPFLSVIIQILNFTKLKNKIESGKWIKTLPLMERPQNPHLVEFLAKYLKLILELGLLHKK